MMVRVARFPLDSGSYCEVVVCGCRFESLTDVTHDDLDMIAAMVEAFMGALREHPVMAPRVTHEAWRSD